jgi:hypothetical protein
MGGRGAGSRSAGKAAKASGGGGGGGASQDVRAASEYTVEYGAGTDRAEVLKALKDWYGGKFTSEDQIGRMAGADPGMRVQVSQNFLGGIRLDVTGGGVSMTRSFEAGGESVYNAYFSNSGQRGSGLGSRIFGRQVRELSRLGVKRIDVTAAGGPGQSMNGYYTWARFGYNGAIPMGVQASLTRASGLPSSLRNATQISQLMRTQQGRDWWRANGSTWNGSFDLKAGSYSRRTFAEYTRSKRRGN